MGGVDPLLRAHVAGEPLSIAHADLVAGLDERQIARVASLGRARVFRAKSSLCRAGERAESLLIVREGCANVTAPLLVLGESAPIRLESLGPGATIGWSALVPPCACAVDAVAVTVVVALAFGREALAQLIAEQPEIGLVLLRNAAGAFARRSVQLQALWLREMQREVDELGGRQGDVCDPHSSW
jgi:CRP-like cAMP-binding protein